jgi:F-type H+-transporting ATPase subunit a
MRISHVILAGGALTLGAVEAAAVSMSPYTLNDGPFPITNSMVMGLVISVLIVLAVRFMVGRPRLVPSKGQAVIEGVINTVREIVEPIVGKRMFRPTFPLLVGLFVFILIHNWSGMLPGVGAFGFYDEAGQLKYWWRPANADLNTTAALGIIAALFGWGYFVLRYAGFKALFFDLFGNKADKQDVGTGIYILLFPIFIGVGFIEIVSIMFRPVSLAFRLYGNVFGGENLLVNMTGLAPYVVPVPFYFLETLIGLVQALVFTLLTAVYIGVICNHGDEHEGAHA